MNPHQAYKAPPSPKPLPDQTQPSHMSAPAVGSPETEGGDSAAHILGESFLIGYWALWVPPTQEGHELKTLLRQSGCHQPFDPVPAPPGSGAHARGPIPTCLGLFSASKPLQILTDSCMPRHPFGAAREFLARGALTRIQQTHAAYWDVYSMSRERTPKIPNIPIQPGVPLRLRGTSSS